MCLCHAHTRMYKYIYMEEASLLAPCEWLTMNLANRAMTAECADLLTGSHSAVAKFAKV